MHASKIRFLFVLLTLLAVSAWLAGCDLLDQSAQCEKLCSLYRRCLDSDYEESRCEKRCLDKVQKSKPTEKLVKSCNKCSEHKACDETSADCDECDDAYQTFLRGAGQDAQSDAEAADAGESDAGEEFETEEEEP